jgi:hypothetical protein
VGQVMWQTGVVTRSWLHPRGQDIGALNGYSVTSLTCSRKRDSHFCQSVNDAAVL